MKKVVIILILIVALVGYLFFVKKDPSIDLEKDYKISEVLEENERVWGGVLTTKCWLLEMECILGFLHL